MNRASNIICLRRIIPGALLLLLLCATHIVSAQKKEKVHMKEMMIDTIDGKLDLGHMLIDMHGFIPVPMIITEPALGSFGGVLAAVFITPKKKIEGYTGYLQPDITAGVGMYTANGSYGAGAFRMGSFPKQGLKYRAGFFYGSLNLSYYRTLPDVGEKEFEFNIQALPVFLSLSKKILKQDVYLGSSYSYAKANVSPRFEGEVPDEITDKELDSNTGTLGVFVDWDKRNSIFTADKGYRFNIEYNVNAQWTASDFEYQRLNTSFIWFTQVKPTWISGLRLEVQHVFERPPFYLMPYIDLRGLPAMRYQGETTLIAETEQRVDLNFRWSVLGFAGVGKAIEFDESYSDGTTVYNVGAGFRYLLARAFKLRTGIDVAMGPDSFGWYIVFGHNWNR